MNKLILVSNIILAAVIPISPDSPIEFKEITKDRADKSRFINATSFAHSYNVKMELEKQEAKSKLVYFDVLTTKREGHVALIFLYKNRYKVYDNRRGVFDLGEHPDFPKPELIAKALSRENDVYTNPYWYNEPVITITIEPQTTILPN